MMYKDKFVSVVKCNGSILREHDNGEGGSKDCVTVPYGSEYSILLKNMESRRASVKIYIDGMPVLFGNALIINANSEIELEGFLDSMSSGNRFKFLKKTQKIVEHRGDKIDDGMIRVEFTYEKRVEEVNFNYNYHTPWWWTNTPTYFIGSSGDPTCHNHGLITSQLSSSDSDVMYSSNASTPRALCNTNIGEDEGITGRGSVSNQSFYYGTIGELEDQGYSIVLRLKGTSKKIAVVKPVTTKSKLQCSMCGTKSKSSSKFCPDCGNALSLNKVV